jgi:acetylornithine deacetylase/succinyl-diaminopimelate desuccinylase-like protein
VDALAYVQSHQDKFLEELKAFLRIPSVSTQPEREGDVERAAQWLRDRLAEAGFAEAEVMPTSGHPVVYGARTTDDPDAPTILIYGHYDVQPPDPLELWETPPFEPTVVGDDLYARGASDDKGQLYVHVKAVEAFNASESELPVNVKCIFEGEEESGSPSLEPFIRDHQELLAADVAVISDTGFIRPDVPSIVYGLRGLAYLEVEVTGPDHDLHSGLYGGAVLNPINALCSMIAQLQDESGRVTVPGFYDRVRELSTEERADLADAPFDRDEWLREAGVETDWGEPDYTIVERTSARPTLDVNGIWGGYTEPGAKTVLPSQAFAKISMRLVPDQDPERIAELVSAQIRDLAPSAVNVRVRALHGAKPAIVERESPVMEAASRAYEEAFGQDPLKVRRGGSIPVVATLQSILGIETVLMGFGLPDDRLHSPNEKFHLPNFYRGIETSVRFMRFLASRFPPGSVST